MKGQKFQTSKPVFLKGQLLPSTVDPQYKNDHNGYSRDNRVILADVIGLGYVTSAREGMGKKKIV